jgi:hypothetical protein
MECLRKCLLDPARNFVRMILLTNNAEKAIAIIEQLMEEVRQQKQVNEQNDVISKIEIGNEARPTERPTEVRMVKEIRTTIREKY